MTPTQTVALVVAMRTTKRNRETTGRWGGGSSDSDSGNEAEGSSRRNNSDREDEEEGKEEGIYPMTMSGLVAQEKRSVASGDISKQINNRAEGGIKSCIICCKAGLFGTTYP